MPRKPNYVERRDKTEGGYVLTQIDEQVFNRMGRPITFFVLRIVRPRLNIAWTPKQCHDFYLKMEYRRQHPIRWKLMRWFHTGGFY